MCVGLYKIDENRVKIVNRYALHFDSFLDGKNSEFYQDVKTAKIYRAAM